jgi:hypothetical protein
MDVLLLVVYFVVVGIPGFIFCIFLEEYIFSLSKLDVPHDQYTFIT